MAVNKRPTFTLANLNAELDDYLLENRSSITGIFLLSAGLLDLIVNIQGGSYLTMLPLTAINSLFGIGSPVVFSVIVLQMLMIGIGGYLSYNSAYRVHLGFALREATVWSLFAGHERDREGAHMELKDKAVLMSIELVFFLMMVALFFSIRDHIIEWTINLPYNEILAAGIVLIAALVGSWIFSSFFRRLWDDRSTLIGVISSLAIVPLGQYALDANAVFANAGMSPSAISEFQGWQFGILIFVMVILATFSVRDLDESVSPGINLGPPADTVTAIDLDPANKPTKCFRGSLIASSGERILSLSQPWSGSGDVFRLHRLPHNLPIISRQFKTWNLSQFDRDLSDPVDYRGVTNNGLYEFTVDVVSSTNVGLLDQPPLCLHRVAVARAETNLLNTEFLKSSIGEWARHKLNSIVEERLNVALPGWQTDDLEPIEIRQRLAGIRAGMKNLLEQEVPAPTEVLWGLDQVSVTQKEGRARRIAEILRETVQQTNELCSVFLQKSVQMAAAELPQHSEEVIRNLAEFSINRSGIPYTEARAGHDQLNEISEDYILELLSIRLAKVDVQLSEKFAQLEHDVEAFINSFASDIQEIHEKLIAAETSGLSLLTQDRHLMRFIRGRGARNSADDLGPNPFAKDHPERIPEGDEQPFSPPGEDGPNEDSSSSGADDSGQDEEPAVRRRRR
tara:strand:- start:25819 stop:27858 length:2040 start_codon:yes stop_codon:yes gene_type:complete